MARRNVTVQLDDAIVHRAKIAAAKRGTSVSALVARQIEALADDDERYDDAWRVAQKAMGAAAPRSGRAWSRDELHTR